ncbi:ArsR/SmtB family transcription factor [Agromyces sp. ZXT2-6]|uniref:ArsR/SmtB family transcription factor n=1 Tax=Agromyces sp. ZXT2-6 TaxID=3461153 RepID=UPI00405511C0
MDDERPTPPGSRLDLRDAGALRAMAHPARLRIIGMLRADGPATVGALAERLGEAPGSVSYHLATLAKHGFVEEAPELARDRRERWWRAAHEMTHWETTDFLDDPEGYDAASAMRRAVLESYHRELLAALDAEPSLEREWVAASESSDGFFHLTADEMRDFAAELDAVAERWRDRGRDPHDGSRGIRYMTHVFPRTGA